MNRIRIFTASYIPATNHRPSRVKVTDTWKNQSIIIPFSSNRMDDTATAFLKSRGIPVTVTSYDKKTESDILGSENFILDIK